MNKFEAVILFSPDLSNPIIKKEEDNFNKVIETLKGKTYLVDAFKNDEEAQFAAIEYIQNMIDDEKLFYTPVNAPDNWESAYFQALTKHVMPQYLDKVEPPKIKLPLR